MRKTLLFLCTLLFLVGCSNEAPTPDPAPVPTSSNRVVFAYIIANNNLDDDLLNNVKWMYEGLASAKDSCTLVIYYKGASDNKYIEGAKILTYRTYGNGYINGEPVLKDSELSIGNIVGQAEQTNAVEGTATESDIMCANFEKMRALAPAKKYGIIFGSHGTGWLPSLKTRSFGQDGSAQNTIDIPTMASALETAFPDRNVDFILFDACMMGTAEVCYELRNATRYCIASVMESPADGFPYHLFMDKLFEDEVDYTYVCDETIRFNTSQDTWGTYAVVDCPQMEQLAQATKEQLTAHADQLSSLSLGDIQQYGYSGYKYFSFDMGHLVKILNGGTMPDEYQQALDKAITYKICMEKSYYNVTPYKDTFCGLGMYLPVREINTTWDAYCPSLAWYEAAGWNELKKD